jgi:acyl-CoA synthetase (NDP forming)
MSKLDGLLPRYAFSTGNQVDLGLPEIVEHLAGDPEVRVFGCYAEGLGWLEGLRLAEAARKIIQSAGDSMRDVIVYKAGRSEEGRHAASGHTAAIAGDWDVAEAILSRVGCIVTRSFTEWQDLVMLSATVGDRPVGGLNLAAISNAGFEAVGIADNISGPGRKLAFAKFSKETADRIAGILDQFGLTELVNLRIPLDVTPMAIDAAHVELAKALADDPGVDFIIHGCVPLSPAMKTREPGGPDGEGIMHPQSFSRLMIQAVHEEIKKPIAIVLDAGDLYDPMEKMFIDAGIPVFRSADEAVRAMGTWAASRIHRRQLAAIAKG